MTADWMKITNLDDEKTFEYAFVRFRELYTRGRHHHLSAQEVKELRHLFNLLRLEVKNIQ